MCESNRTPNPNFIRITNGSSLTYRRIGSRRPLVLSKFICYLMNHDHVDGYGSGVT